jgi:hypothetical protein
MVKFFPVYADDYKTIVGEVKHDPLRENLKWTALDKDGVRIKDVSTRAEAEHLCRVRNASLD